MSSASSRKGDRYGSHQLRLAGIVASLAIPFAGSTAVAGIIWNGDFSTGDFRQWHNADSNTAVSFWQIPEYGRPINYGGVAFQQTGDGSLLSLVTSPTRGSGYSAKFTVKNAVNGVEPRDCDGGVCTRRRTELTMQQTLPRYYNAIPYQRERWISFSVFVPSDWSDAGTGWGPLLLSLKPLNEGPNGTQGALGFGIVGGKSWLIYMNWRAELNPDGGAPWQYTLEYTGNMEGTGVYPRSDFWPEGLVDFPNVQASHAALSSVLKGGWTDWIMNVKFDARGAAEGGTGFFKVWKREGNGSWVQVLDVRPKRTTRGGMTFDHGIGFNSPPSNGNNGGFGLKTGLYMEKGEVWGLPRDRVVYIANVKVGDENTAFSTMTPDGSRLDGSVAKPNPPTALSVE